MNRTAWLWAALAWAGVIFWLLTWRTPSIPHGSWLALPPLDKLVHASLFGLLAALCYFALPAGRAWWGALALAVGYGAATELLQYYVFTWRDGEWLDLLADTLGALLALWLATRLPWLRRPASPSPPHPPASYGK